MTFKRPEVLKIFIMREFKSGKTCFKEKRFSEAFFHFERAHILGQKNVLFHTFAHLWMLRVALANRDFKEIVGQIFRIPTGFLGSIFGIVPIGNSGGSNVNPFQSMPIPEDLKKILEQKC